MAGEQPTMLLGKGDGNSGWIQGKKIHVESSGAARQGTEKWRGTTILGDLQCTPGALRPPEFPQPSNFL